MKKFLWSVVAVSWLASCAAPPPPQVRPVELKEKVLIDPRSGFAQAVPPRLQSLFDQGWRAFQSGDYAGARTAFDEVLSREPEYPPARLAEAGIDLREGKLERAEQTTSGILHSFPDYTAAEVYAAEIAIQKNQPRKAYELYRKAQEGTSLPRTTAARLEDLRSSVYQELYEQALTVPPGQAIPLLRKALEVRPDASQARVLLVQDLIREHEYAQAEQLLGPMLSTTDASQVVELQEAQAEIAAGQGNYESAIARYRQLAQQHPEQKRFSTRLEELKEQFAEANLPPQFRKAVESRAITRADFAVLLYWEVDSVRFAQNLGVPPIATDVAGLPAREELVRAISLGLLPVDPVTRRVGANAALNTAAMSRIVARLLSSRGADCARGIPNDPVLIWNACKLPNPLMDPQAPVSGRDASAILREVNRHLPS